MPILVIAGTRDFQAVEAPVKAFFASRPNVRYLPYEGRGHFMFVEDPDRFAHDVVAFLKPSAL